MFKAIGDHCGGWISTEEHLKWARILVKGGGDLIPKEVKFELAGVGYVIQIWDETPTKFFDREDMGDAGSGESFKSLNQRIIERPGVSFKPSTAVNSDEHVHCTKFF